MLCFLNKADLNFQNSSLQNLINFVNLQKHPAFSSNQDDIVAFGNDLFVYFLHNFEAKNSKHGYSGAARSAKVANPMRQKQHVCRGDS